MQFELLTPSLDELDGLSDEILALPVFMEDSPPHGLPGLVDWRLHNRISKLLARSNLPTVGAAEEVTRTGDVQIGFSGMEGERLLLPGGRLLPFQWVLFYGLGTPNGYGVERYRDTVRALVDSIVGLKVRSACLVLPAWQRAGVTARASVEILLKALWKKAPVLREPLDRLVVAEVMSVHGDLSDAAHDFLERLG